MITLPKINTMKQVFLVALLVAGLASCKDRNKDKLVNLNNTGQTKFKDTAMVKIIDSAYNFGTVTDGEKVVFSYRFVNPGKVPLVIDKAQPTCGCTIAESPKDPINTGDTGYIKIEFNSKGRVGEAHKTILVYSNAFQNFPALLLNGTVVAAKE